MYVLIIEEFLMIVFNIMYATEKCCKEAKPVSEELFSGIFTYQIFDIRQPPPVQNKYFFPAVRTQLKERSNHVLTTKTFLTL